MVLRVPEESFTPALLERVALRYCTTNALDWWFSEHNSGPYFSTLIGRIPIIRTPKYGTSNFRKLPDGSTSNFGALRSLETCLWSFPGLSVLV